VEVKAAALRAMAKHPGKETWDVGVEYVRSGDSPTIRMAALGIVMGRHDKEAASLLEQIASSDSDDQVKAAAADAARLIRQELEREKK
jgi:hypothetical protein